MKCIISECRNYLKLAVLAQTLICLLTASAITASAQEAPQNPDSAATEYVRLYVNDVEYPPERAVLTRIRRMSICGIHLRGEVCAAALDETRKPDFSGEDHDDRHGRRVVFFARRPYLWW